VIAVRRDSWHLSHLPLESINQMSVGPIVAWDVRVQRAASLPVHSVSVLGGAANPGGGKNLLAAPKSGVGKDRICTSVNHSLRALKALVVLHEQFPVRVMAENAVDPLSMSRIPGIYSLRQHHNLAFGKVVDHDLSMRLMQWPHISQMAASV